MKNVKDCKDINGLVDFILQRINPSQYIKENLEIDQDFFIELCNKYVEKGWYGTLTDLCKSFPKFMT